MRLTTVIIIASIMQVSASTFGQTITINKKNISLEAVLKEIRVQSGYDILFDGKILPGKKNIDLNVRNANINEVMAYVLTGLPLSYSIHGKIISINQKEDPSFLDRIISSFAKIDVKGRVVDENGKPMAGATVMVNGVHLKVSTNEKGEFYLRDVQDNATIIIAFVGYSPVERMAAADLGTIKMELLTDKLEDVEIKFNTGYEQISKDRSAGSFAKPDLKVMQDRSSSTNILTRLEGLVPGLSNGSGQSGGIVVRGTTSINAATSPLVVVDGVQVQSIENVNMQDVEDITVLKDATSASIWGAQAANGVIVITTRKGKAGEKLKIDYDGYYAFQGRTNREYLPSLNAAQAVAIGREIFLPSVAATNYNTARSNGAMTPLTQLLWDEKDNRINATQAQSKYDSLSRIDNRAQIDELFVRDASTLNQTLSASGGGNVHTFYGSLNHIGSQNNIPGSKNNRYKINLNNTFTFGKRVKLNLNADLTNSIMSSKGGNAFDVAIAAPRYQLFEDANGSPLTVNYLAPIAPDGLASYHDSFRADYQARSRINLDYNPLLETERQYATINNLGVRLVGGGTVDILKGLKFTGTYGYNYTSVSGRTVLDEKNYGVRNLLMRYTVAANPTVTPVYNLPLAGGRLTTNNELNRGWTLRNQLSYRLDWNKNQISLMAGQEATHAQNVTNGAVFYGWDDQLQVSRPVDFVRLSQSSSNGVAGLYGNLPNNLSGGEQAVIRTTSYFATAGYTYDRKYTLNASWRIDQSNLFGLDKSAQNKPVYSFGGKWSLGNEEFLKPVGWLNSLDLRLSYGITGNAPNVGSAASFDILEAQANAAFVTGAGIILRTPKNDKLTWERTQVYNAGMDFSILKGRFSGQVDVYLKKTSDLIGSLFTSPLTGYSSVTGNFGDLENKGIDIGFNSVNISNAEFQWSTGLVLGYNKNKLTKLNINPPTTAGNMISAVRLVGRPLNLLFSYDYAGLNAQGDPQIRRADGSLLSAPNIALPADVVYSGLTQAPWNGGLNNNFRFRNFSLAVNIVYSLGHKFRDKLDGLDINNPEFLDRWKVAGDENTTDIPRWLRSGSPESAARATTFYTNANTRVLDASYAKIRDITLAYSLPQLFIKRLNLQAVTFRLQVSNLLIWTANDMNYDPEAIIRTRNAQGAIVESNGRTLSAQGTATIGAHITF